MELVQGNSIIIVNAYFVGHRKFIFILSAHMQLKNWCVRMTEVPQEIYMINGKQSYRTPSCVNHPNVHQNCCLCGWFIFKNYPIICDNNKICKLPVCAKSEQFFYYIVQSCKKASMVLWLIFVLFLLAVNNPKRSVLTLNETFLGLLFPTESYKV